MEELEKFNLKINNNKLQYMQSGLKDNEELESLGISWAKEFRMTQSLII